MPRNSWQFSQTERALSETDSTTNGFVQPPICGHDTEDSSSLLRSPRLVALHAEYNPSRESTLRQAFPCNPCPRTDAGALPVSLRVVRLLSRPGLTPEGSHHAAVPRLRLSTAGFHSRRPADFAWSRFFPLSVGFGPTASIARGALTIEPSMLCHDHAIPSRSSYSANPLRQRRTNTPWRFHSKKYLWTELALPYSLLGNAFHWHPVRNTYTIPSKILRGSMGLRPPPGRRRYFRFLERCRSGIRGLMRSQSSSETVHDFIALIAQFLSRTPRLCQ
jgi:hypothetical protein